MRWRRPQDGKLVARPTGLLLSALKLTLFETASVYVEGVEARALASEPGEGARYRVVDVGEPAVRRRVRGPGPSRCVSAEGALSSTHPAERSGLGGGPR